MVEPCVSLSAQAEFPTVCLQYYSAPQCTMFRHVSQCVLHVRDALLQAKAMHSDATSLRLLCAFGTHNSFMVQLSYACVPALESHVVASAAHKHMRIPTVHRKCSVTRSAGALGHVAHCLALQTESQALTVQVGLGATMCTALLSLRASARGSMAKRAPISLVIAMDCSASMGCGCRVCTSGCETQLTLCKETISFMCNQLVDDDFVSLVTFGSKVRS